MTMLSIAIATYNRADELKLTLQSLEALRVGDGLGFEVLVVDNNSSDATRSVVEAFEGRLAGELRYIHEPKQGLSQARNRAIAEARFEVVAFLDDDVDVDPDWLIGMASAFQDGDRAAVGGRACLAYPGRKPRWLGERDEGYLTKVELGPDPRAAASDELFGVNLAFSKGWVLRVGGFRTDLGRIGTCLIGGEEGELLERIAGAGGNLRYEPSAVVNHRVPAGRLTRRWFWSRSYWGYRGEVRRLGPSDVSSYALIRATWHLALAGWSVALSPFSAGFLTEETFHRSLILAGRLGTWIGLASALSIRSTRSRVEPERPTPGGSGRKTPTLSSST